MPFSARQLYVFIALACAGLLGYALYTEHFQGLIPCALCMTQRFFFACTGAFALLAALHDPATTGRRIYAGLMTLVSALGAGVVAARLAPRGELEERAAQPVVGRRRRQREDRHQPVVAQRGLPGRAPRAHLGQHHPRHPLGADRRRRRRHPLRGWPGRRAGRRRAASG